MEAMTSHSGTGYDTYTGQTFLSGATCLTRRRTLTEGLH